jgi:hypothetical protein
MGKRVTTWLDDTSGEQRDEITAYWPQGTLNLVTHSRLAKLLPKIYWRLSPAGGTDRCSIQKALWADRSVRGE